MTYEEFFKNGDKFLYESHVFSDYIIYDVENSLDFTLYDDYQTFAVGFEELTDLIDNAIRKAKK